MTHTLDKERLLECAKAYIGLGWRILPVCYPVDGKCTCGRGCEKPGKSPHCKLAPNGSKDATTDWPTIQSWFHSDLDFNIGICAGTESGLVIVDIDPGHGGFESLKKLVKSKIITPKVITGSEGGHLYFKHPGGSVRNSAGTVAPGIDIRGKNGYVVAPPSMHISGKEYRWGIDPTVELAPMPAWVTKKQKKRSGTAISDSEGSGSASNDIPDGQRDDELTRIAGGLRRVGLGEEAIYTHLCTIKCDPPKSDADLRRIAGSVARYEPDPVASSLMLNDCLPDTIAKAYEDASPYKHKYHPNDGWSMYKDDQYQRIDADKQLSRYVSAFIGGCSHQPGKDIKRVALHGRSIKDVIQQVAYLPSVYLTPRQEAPCWLNSEQGHRRVIPLKNGLLDWTTLPFTLIPHTPDYYTQNYLPFAWNGDITSDLWDGYLADSSSNDSEFQRLLQQFAGYCLMKNNHDQQKFLLCYGESGTGKSVYADILSQLLGLENVSTVPLALFADSHMVTQAYGKMLNVSDEAAECLCDPAVENALKSYTGGTMFPFKELYKPPFSAYPTAKILITSNNKPKFKDSSEGIWRRLMFAPFENIVPDNEIDLELKAKIIATEMPGVLAWALRGAIDLMESGTFVVPGVSKDAISLYRDEMHPERTFIAENFELSDNEELWVKCKGLRRAYESWSKDNNFGVKNDTNLGRAVFKVFKGVVKSRIRLGGTREYIYRKLSVRHDSEYFDMVMGYLT